MLALGVPTTGAVPQRRSARRPTVLPIIARRLVLMVPTLFGIVTITFILTHALGGNPSRQIAGQLATPAELAKIAQEYGFNHPLIVQYWNYLVGILHGSLGVSTQTNHTVVSDLLNRFPSTLELVVLSIAVALLIGVPLGAFAGRTSRRVPQALIRGYSFVFLAVPDFWLALVLIYVVFFRLGWLPGPTGQLALGSTAPHHITGAIFLDAVLDGDGSAIWPAFQHVILPVGVLALVLSAPITRLTRSSMLAVMESDFMRFGASTGLGRRRLWRYAIRGSIPPVITFTGTLFTLLLGGTVLIETVFSWGGAAQYAANAIQQNDFAATQGFVLVCGFLAILAFLAVDLIQMSIDPRIRSGGGSSFALPGFLRRGATTPVALAAAPSPSASRAARQRWADVVGSLQDTWLVLVELVGDIDIRNAPRAVRRTLRSGNTPLFAGAGIIATLIVAAYVVPAVWAYKVNASNALNTLQHPSLRHLFGTDSFGFDIFVRVVYASRTDLSIAAEGVFLSAAVGVLLGLLVGFSRRTALDEVVMRVVDMIQAFPVLIVAVALVAFAGNSLTNVVWALAFINAPIFLRLARSQVLTVREHRYVEAATALNNSRPRILVRHVLPNVLGPVIVQVGISLGYAILTVAALAFLGLGVQAPTPEWGSMILSGKDSITTGQWWTVVFPGVAVLVAVAGFNLLAEGVERARDIYR
jgi:ABC-type dipeptide/oligopeptide/nickel transport system permease component